MSAYYLNSLPAFIQTDPHQILGALTKAYGVQHYEQKDQQTKSWDETITLFKRALTDLRNGYAAANDWTILLEYKIPRRGKKIDAVIIARDILFVIEAKLFKKKIETADEMQLEDYCLDLRDFHFESRSRCIVPVLFCSDANARSNAFNKLDDAVQEIVYCNKENLADNLRAAFEAYSNRAAAPIDAQAWNSSKYLPTPTIIEAAQVMYAKQSVKEITRHHAGENLTKTADAVLRAIADAQRTQQKAICFITGVPGAGKTLAGLNIVHSKQVTGQDHLGVFLSGNSPLVKVLSEALARDLAKREGMTKVEGRRRVSTFVQNVHVFLEKHFLESEAPPDRVVIFDEAQRAWDAAQSKRKFNRDFSEAEMMLEIMSRHKGWAVIVALIGGGQEINSGEAGLPEWGKVLKEKFPFWKIHISPELKQGDHSTGNLTLFMEQPPAALSISENHDLHLRVSIRSYKAQEYSAWVAQALEGDHEKAKEIYEQGLRDFPIAITRSLDTAKQWLRAHARGSRRCGLVASSGARRLRAHGLDPFSGLRGNSTQEELGAWYLHDKNDVRSSSFLEIPATEYAVQGLEIDWVGMCWGSDFTWNANDWRYRQFKGTKWQKVDKAVTRQYIKNKYRVLLTRAREGVIIWIPEGSDEDATRDRKHYDETFAYLKSCGLPVL